jgi:cobalt-zinc-cadmium efflux system membrane fusion protein
MRDPRRPVPKMTRPGALVVVIGSVLSSALVALVACGESGSKAEPVAPTADAHADEAHAGDAHAEDRRASVGASLIEARAASGVVLQTLTGTTVPVAGARFVVAAPLEGRVRRIHVSPGDKVKAGQLLVELVLPALAQAAAAHDGAALRIAALEKRAATLASVEKEGLVRADARLQIEVDLASARAELASARAVIGAALGRAPRENETAPLVESGGRYQLTSPADAVVTAVHAVDGALTDALPLVELAREGTVKIEVRAPADALTGVDVQLSDARLAAPVLLTLLSTDPRVDGALTRMWLTAEAPLVLPAGLVVQLSLLVREGSDALVVPKSALLPDDGGALLVVRGDALVTVPVKVRARASSQVVVVGDVKPGEQIVRETLREESGEGGGGHVH